MLTLNQRSNIGFDGRWFFPFREESAPGTDVNNPLLPDVQADGWHFQFTTTEVSQVVWSDPEIVFGYDYEITGGAYFRSFILPVLGDNWYELWLGDAANPYYFADIFGGSEYFFSDFNFADGVNYFGIRGVESSLKIDSNDVAAFVWMRCSFTLRITLMSIPWFRSIPCLLVAFTQTLAASTELPEGDVYKSLHTQWLDKTLSLRVEADPRLDTDQLRPIVNYDRDIVEVRSTDVGRRWLLVDAGWQLVGGLVDLVETQTATYLLIGRQSLYYKGGLWNNILDSSQSFDEFFLIKRDEGQLRLIAAKRVDTKMSQILLGLRVMPGNDGLEVVQNSPSGLPRSIFIYRF